MLNIGNPKDWQQVQPDESMVFESDGFRRLKLAFNSDMRITVWQSSTEEGDDELLIFSGEGVNEFQMHLNGNTLFRIEADEGANIFVKGSAADHRVQKREIEAFTSVAPQKRVNSELERVMLVMKHNEKMRQQTMARELQKVRDAQAALDAKVIESDPPAPPATPPATPPADPPADPPAAPKEGDGDATPKPE